MITIVDINASPVVDSVTLAAQNVVGHIILLLPGLIAAILIFVLGWIVAILVSRLFARFFKLLRLEEFLKQNRVEDALGTVKISDVLTKIVKYYVMLIFFQAAVSLIDLGTLSTYLANLLLYVPVLIGGTLIVLVSVLLGEYLKESITELSSKSNLVKIGARAVKLLVICIGVTMGLATAGFDTTLITGIFLTLVQAMAFGIALAFAIAFGFGGQEDAKEVIQSTRKNFKV